MYQGKATTTKINRPHNVALQDKNFKSFLSQRKDKTISPGKNNPNGPLLKTAKAEKKKYSNNPTVFLL
jgi:hypothetical protein